MQGASFELIETSQSPKEALVDLLATRNFKSIVLGPRKARAQDLKGIAQNFPGCFADFVNHVQFGLNVLNLGSLVQE